MLRKSVFALLFISGLALAQTGPKISVSPLTYDMGDIKEGDVVTKVYTVKNEGSAVLNIRNVSVSCGCTVAKLKTNDLQPGESTELTVTFNSSGREGKQSKTVMILSNDLSSSSARVTFTANVLTNSLKNSNIPSSSDLLAKRVSLKSPKLAFNEKVHDFGKLNEGKVTRYTFNFTNTGGSTLDIGFVVTSGGGIATRLSSRKIEPGKNGTLKVEFDTSNLKGKVAKNIKIGSNDPDEPTQILIITADVVR
ncbi:MAG: DUF1573 domain-containing protein [Ignavibacteria bacterium]|jgi:uncharacterized cupredoxin-like copper-binding protein|nr:DUF1573 domain-containing protein [Ignavibacteria bacterium]MCU7502899.1 DUF1573 domain-containing protein [Ignavibacteria bacterium]MCU7515607.1 DUF1573 domain-containing protein [Ignavibacteria bacterium]